MYLTRTEYDRGVNTFSPEGRLFQVEYAIEAIKLGTTAIGIKTAEGVVLAVEKRLASILLEPSSIEKIVEIDSHIAAAHSGLAADARTLVQRARVEAQNHRFTFAEPIKTRSLTQSVCDLCLQFSEDSKEKLMSRPFGVAFLFAGVDKDGVQLYHTDPSGTFIEYKAKVIGAGEQAQLTLEEQYRSDMTLAEVGAAACMRSTVVPARPPMRPPIYPVDLFALLLFYFTRTFCSPRRCFVVLRV
jgi:20S proteasome subunit alpha 5